MPSKILNFRANKRPVVVGAGLIALDVMLDERTNKPPKLWAGGTCGNVLTILAFLGWRSMPVSRLGRDAASRLIVRDMKRWGVDVSYACLGPTVPGPIIVHRLRQNSAGEPFHSFSLNCPDCGRRLPSYRPVPAGAIEAVLPSIPSPNVFFADRVSRGVINVAQAMRARGALIVFEPSGNSEVNHFREMLSITHVLKYSQERLPDLDVDAEIPLVVETMGQGGLRFKSCISGAKSKGWQRCEPYNLNRQVDTAGAGDWCTAGILHTLGIRGAKSLIEADSTRLRGAISLGQALAAWNCGYRGARGGMYSVSKEEFEETLRDIFNNGSHLTTDEQEAGSDLAKVVPRVCSECRESGKTLNNKPLLRLLHG